MWKDFEASKSSCAFRLFAAPSRQSADQPIHAHIETVCDLADTIKIESARSCNLKIKERRGQQFRCYGVVRHATNAASFGKAITKEAEVSRRPAYMEGGA